MGNIFCKRRQSINFKKYKNRYLWRKSKKSNVMKLSEEEIIILKEKTGFGDKMIEAWYEAFMVLIYLYFLSKSIF